MPMLRKRPRKKNRGEKAKKPPPSVGATSSWIGQRCMINYHPFASWFRLIAMVFQSRRKLIRLALATAVDAVRYRFRSNARARIDWQTKGLAGRVERKWLFRLSNWISPSAGCMIVISSLLFHLRSRSTCLFCANVRVGTEWVGKREIERAHAYAQHNLCRIKPEIGYQIWTRGNWDKRESWSQRNGVKWAQEGSETFIIIA